MSTENAATVQLPIPLAEKLLEALNRANAAQWFSAGLDPEVLLRLRHLLYGKGPVPVVVELSMRDYEYIAESHPTQAVAKVLENMATDYRLSDQESPER